MKTKRIVLCGLGRVGKAFLGLAAERAEAVRSRYGLNIEVGGAVDIGGAAIAAVEGILNGTTNFILTKMSREKVSYADALREAQALGIAETDPALDVEGYDTRNKIVLIANTLFAGSFGIGDVPVKGITGVTYDDIARGAKAGKALKLVATARATGGKVSLAVGPTYLDRSHPLAAVDFAEKGVTYTTDTMGQITVLGGKSSPVGAAAALLKDVIHTHLFGK